MPVLFDSPSFKVYQKSHQVYFKEQAQILVYLGGIGFILGLLFYGLKLLFPATSAIYIFMNWGSLLIMGASGLLLLLAIIIRIKKPVIIDLDKRIVIRKNKTISFSNSGGLDVKPYLFANNPHLRIELSVEQSVYYITPLLPEKYESELLTIINTINEKLVARPANTQFEIAPPVLYKHFIAWVVCLLGAILAITGWYFTPELVFAAPGEQGGILVWPFGIWIMMLGLFHLIGVDIFRKRPVALSRKEKLLLFCWALSYYIICSV